MRPDEARPWPDDQPYPACISWRAAFLFQAAIVVTIVLLSRRVVDPVQPDPERPFDALGAVLSAVGMFFLVFGILQAGDNNTLLVDRLPFLGGTSTAVLDTFYAFYTPGEKARRVVGGIGWEVAERLKAGGMAFERPNTYGAGTGVTYDPEVLKVLWERLAEDAKVDILLHTWATGVELHAGQGEAQGALHRTGPVEAGG